MIDRKNESESLPFVEQSVMKIRKLSLALILLTSVATARAELVRLEITQREPYAAGKAMGDRGAYERLRGKAHFALDPRLEANRSIVDLELCPVNAEGRVEFSADVEMLAPVDHSKASGSALYEVNNRGGKTATSTFIGGADDFLLRQGFVVVWSGWIAEVLPGGERLLMTAPAPLLEGRPLRGVVRQDFVVSSVKERASVMHRANQGAYRPASNSQPDAKLTRRLREADPRVEVPRDQWKFVITEFETDAGRTPLPQVEVELAGGLQPGYIYEVIYEAEGSVVQGAGLAGIRDLLSFLKYDATEKNPLRTAAGQPVVQRFHGFGTSQSGRCLRQILYDGFNADEQGRPAFDGILSHVAGGALGFFNHRFASPTRTNGQHEEHSFPADMFPFTYGDEEDPFAKTSTTDGILRKARAAKTLPKVMHTQSSSEYWHRSGSLVHTDPLGQRDAKIPEEVRIYAFGGTQHGAGSGVAGPRGDAQLPSNPADYRPLMRALFMALDAWVREGREPPASVYPRIAEGTLVSWRQADSGWHTISGVAYPQVIQQPSAWDRGPEWLTKRRISQEPPIARGNYVVRVPAFGPDNNERGCLNLPTLSVPVATYTPWNMRSASIGAEGELLGLQGGYIPFAKTKAERESAGDPRPALLERYRDFGDYQRQLMAAAEKLLADRYLLAEDLPRIKALSEKHRPFF
jgi:hypothetical protein